MGSRLSVAFTQLRHLLNLPPSKNTRSAFARNRNVVLDILAEGRRKNIIHLFFEVDATAARAQIASNVSESGETVSITSYTASILARCVAANPRMHAYRHKGGDLVMFDDVDLSIMIEREIDGELLPLPYIVRGANKKDFFAVDRELKHAKTAPLFDDGPLSALEAQFFALPRMFRKLVWYFARSDAHLFRELAGTVGVTSIGMHASGRVFVLPITPMTLTLAIGAISSVPVFVDGIVVERESLQLTISADHDVIDGAPLLRFVGTLKTSLEHGIA